MKKKKLLFCLLAAVVFVAGLSTKALAANEVLKTDISAPAAGNVFVKISGGHFITSAERTAIINRINEIRQEAVKIGYADRYIPIKWDYKLEQYAQIRSAEASVRLSHTRSNGKSCFNTTMVSPSSEIIAWGGDARGSIEQWYSEIKYMPKRDGVTGHYEALINPNNQYFGMGNVNTGATYHIYGQANAGSLSTYSSGMAAPTHSSASYTQIIEIEGSAVKGISASAAKQNISLNESTKATAKAVFTYNGSDVVYNVENKTAEVCSGVTWSALNPTIATIDSSGNIKGIKAGKAGFKVVAAGRSVTFYVNVKNPPPTFNSVTVPATATVGKAVNVKANMSGDTSGVKYKFVWSRNGSWAKGNWGVIHDFNATSTASLKPAKTGTYDFYVDVKFPDGKITTKSKQVKVNNIAALNSVSVPSTGKVGTTITITPNVTGTKTGLKYKFVWSRNGSWAKGNWGVIRDFNAASTASLKPTKTGTYDFYVDVKFPNGEVVTKSGKVKVTNIATLNSISVPSTGKVGTAITITPNVTGTKTGLKYKFVWSRNGSWAKGNWGVIRDFSAISTASLKPTKTGTYDFYVDVKFPNGEIATKSGKVKVGNIATFNSISVPSTGKVGTAIKITPNVTGTKTGLKYKFVWSRNGSWAKGNWGVLHDFSATSMASFKPTKTGTYDFYVDLKFPNGEIVTKNKKVVVK